MRRQKNPRHLPRSHADIGGRDQESLRAVRGRMPTYEYDSPPTNRSISRRVLLPEVAATGARDGKAVDQSSRGAGSRNGGSRGARGLREQTVHRTGPQVLHFV